MSLIKIATLIREKINSNEYQKLDSLDPIKQPVAISRPVGVDLKKFYPSVLSTRVRS